MKKKEMNGYVHGRQNGKLFAYLLFFLILGCVKPIKKVDSVRIFYLPEKMLVPLSLVDCDEIFVYNNLLSDTIIKDKETIDKIIEGSKYLEISDDTTSLIDYRIRCTIKYSNKSRSIICMGAFNGISFDGMNMKDDSTYLNLIKNIIYD